MTKESQRACATLTKRQMLGNRIPAVVWQHNYTSDLHKYECIKFLCYTSFHNKESSNIDTAESTNYAQPILTVTMSPPSSSQFTISSLPYLIQRNVVNKVYITVAATAVFTKMQLQTFPVQKRKTIQ